MQKILKDCLSNQNCSKERNVHLGADVVHYIVHAWSIDSARDSRKYSKINTFRRRIINYETRNRNDSECWQVALKAYKFWEKCQYISDGK